nr:hypothetical protein [Alkaliphilus metalliredigens]
MIEIINNIFRVIAAVLAGYSLIIGNFDLMPYILFFFGVSILISGFVELQREKKSFWGYMRIAYALFIFWGLIKSFLLN